MYSAELLTNPLPFVLALSLTIPMAAAVLLVAGVAALRIAQVALIAHATSAPLRPRQLLAVPLLDLLQFGAQFVPYFSDRVTWGGYTARIGPSTRLYAIEQAA